MKRPDVLAVIIVLGVVMIGIVGLVADSFSSSNLAGQAMYLNGYRAGYQRVPASVSEQIRVSPASALAAECDCPKEEEESLVPVTTMKYAAPAIQASCSENDESLAGTSSIRHNAPTVQETLTVRQGSTILQTKEDSCFGDELIQWECNPDDPQNPRQFRQRCDVECRSGRCASHAKPIGSCKEFEHGVSGSIGSSSYRRVAGYLTDSCANHKVLVDVFCGEPPYSSIRERSVVCPGECRSSPVRLPNGESRPYGRCV